MTSSRRGLGGRRLSLLVLLLALSVALTAAGLVQVVTARTPSTDSADAPRIASPRCDGTPVRPGSDPQAQLQSRPAGASFCFSAGIYRLASPLRPKARQRLIAEPGAVLSGARVITQWTRSGRSWRASGHLPADPRPHGECVPDYRGCRYAEAMFYDDRQLWRVDALEDVAPGRFYQDYGANAIWIGEDPSGRTVEVARAEAAITGDAEGVMVDGFVIEKFANRAQSGAVYAQGPDWVIQNNDVRLNHGHGIHSDSAKGQVLGNHLHHNGQMGLGGDGNDHLVAGNEIDHNNTAGFLMVWEAGGMKWGHSRGLLVSGNVVHHNEGPGLWTDINNIDTTYERNVVYDNSSHGIFHEISYEAVIRDNRISDNGRDEPLQGWGGAGIRVAASPNVEIHGNVLVGNTNGIMLVQQRRTDSPSPYGPHELREVSVHDNDVSMSQNLTGMVNDTGDDSFYRRNIQFRRNTYRLADRDGRFFGWADDEWDRTAWTQRFGQDTEGRFLQL